MKKSSWVFAPELEFAASVFVRPALVPALIRLPIMLILGGIPSRITFPSLKTGNVFRDILLALPRLCKSTVEYALFSFSLFLHMLFPIGLPKKESRFRRWYDWASGSNGVYDRPYWDIVDEAQQDHKRALEALNDAVMAGRGFVLLLRDFPEEDLYDDKGFGPALGPLGIGMLIWLKAYSTRGGRWRFLYDLAHVAGADRPVVTLGNPRSSLPTARRTTGVRHLYVANWIPAIQLLIQQADFIIGYGGQSGKSMEFELSEILRKGKEENTVLISRTSSSLYDNFPKIDYPSLARMLGYDGDPSQAIGDSDESWEAFDNRKHYANPQITIKRLIAEWIQTARYGHLTLQRRLCLAASKSARQRASSTALRSLR
jgi:hypothetical protein